MNLKLLKILMTIGLLTNQSQSEQMVRGQKHVELENQNIITNIRDQKNQNKKKHFLSVCALFNNEAQFLKEWIEYHLLIGVNHFYLYNLESTDPYIKILSEYISQVIIKLIHWHNCIKNEIDPDFANHEYLWPLSAEITAYENAMQFKAIQDTEWLVMLDVNEFLVFQNELKIREVLEKYSEFPGIVLSCDYFDASAKKVFPQRKLLIETLELTKAPKYNPYHAVVKMIFKPHQCNGFIWPPYKMQFMRKQHAIAIGKREMRINHYVNRKENLFSIPANIAYVDNRLLSDDEMEKFFNLGYRVEDQDHVIYRFIPELLVRMSYDPLWGW